MYFKNDKRQCIIDDISVSVQASQGELNVNLRIKQNPKTIYFLKQYSK